MFELFFLLAFAILVVGVLIGARWEEINLRARERRLAQDRRWVNSQLRALQAHQDMNNLIWQSQNELRQAAVLQAQDIPPIVAQQLEAGLPRQRNGARRATERSRA